MAEHLEYLSHNEAETEALGVRLAGVLTAGTVVAYQGGLGMGKTCFTRGLAAGLGIDPAEVSSPTFALVNEYRGGRLLLWHFDMYRVESFDALYSTGFFDYLDLGGVLALEWSENINGALPEGTIYITFERLGDERRSITIEGGAKK